MLLTMIHWLRAKHVSWSWDRKPQPSVLAPGDFLVLAALDRKEARDAKTLLATNPTFSADSLEDSFIRLLHHGLVRRHLRPAPVRYKLSRHGAHLLAASQTTI
jgi:DNA-binding HxlR family transcriptional regulator